jgi:hypothetical protein
LNIAGLIHLLPVKDISNVLCDSGLLDPEQPGHLLLRCPGLLAFKPQLKFHASRRGIEDVPVSRFRFFGKRQRLKLLVHRHNLQLSSRRQQAALPFLKISESYIKPPRRP